MLKKVLLSSIMCSSLILASCSSQQTDLSNSTLDNNNQTQAQSVKKIQLSLDKLKTPETKKSESKLTNKKSKGDVKKPAPLEIMFSPPTGKNNLDPTSVVQISRIALNSMNSAQSYESGYKTSLVVLEKLASENIYIAKIGLAMAKSGMYYETCFKVTAAALENIASERPVSVAETCNLISKIMSNTKSYEEGAKLGYAAMEIIGSSDNENVRFLVNTSVTAAKQGMYWEDIYKTLQNTLTELKNF
ncbi:MAG: hypothetical protein AABZ74_06675 [Cyanobacteriota bacterium]|mgnify:CR=1 FL=1